MFARKIRVDWLAETVAKESIKSIKAVSATKLTPAQLRTNQWSLGFPGFRHQGASVWAPGAPLWGKIPRDCLKPWSTSQVMSQRHKAILKIHGLPASSQKNWYSSIKVRGIC